MAVQEEDEAAAENFWNADELLLSDATRFQLDDLCSGCRMSTRDVANETTCWNRISRLLLGTNPNNNLTVKQAAIKIASEHPDQCQRCHPATCRDTEKRYWHVDRVAPKIHHAVTFYLKSLPEQYRLPVRALDNWTEYFKDRNNSRPFREYFLEYNPSIVQLPADQKKVSRDAEYLVCFRVSNHYIYIFEKDKISDMIGGMKQTYMNLHEYYGFATLRADLTIIDETVVQAHPVMMDHGRATEDMRLVVIQDQMYMKVDNRVFPMWLISPTRHIPVPVVTMERVPNSTTPTALEIFFGTKGPCTQLDFGKNLNYFQDVNGRTVMEVYPMIDRRYIDFESYNCSDHRDFTGELPQINDSRTVPKESFATSDEILLADHNMPFLPYTFQRGSACCISIIDPRNGREMLMGASHVRTGRVPWSFSTNGVQTDEVKYTEDSLRRLYRDNSEAAKEFRQGNLMDKLGIKRSAYFSSFYAFETTPPYKTIARTGRFCFGLPNATEIKQAGHLFQHPNTPPTKILSLAGVSYDCPQIQFISGMVDKVGDPSRVIFSYGVNDGMSRIVEVEKAYIAKMLFTPEDM